jgi:hypothetical protein
MHAIRSVHCALIEVAPASPSEALRHEGSRLWRSGPRFGPDPDGYVAACASWAPEHARATSRRNRPGTLRRDDRAPPAPLVAVPGAVLEPDEPRGELRSVQRSRRESEEREPHQPDGDRKARARDREPASGDRRARRAALSVRERRRGPHACAVAEGPLTPTASVTTLV